MAALQACGELVEGRGGGEDAAVGDVSARTRPRQSSVEYSSICAIQPLKVRPGTS